MAPTNLDSFFIVLLVALEVLQLQALCPIPLVQVHKHGLLQLRLPVIHRYRVVMPIEAMDERLNGRFVDMPDVRRRLAGFLTGEKHVWIDKTEGIDDDFALDGLDWVYDNCDRTGV